jgi:lipoprotein-anchoring transpeptidase ErfK/SrfK
MKARSITARATVILGATALLALTLGAASAMAATTLHVHAGPYGFDGSATSTVVPSLVTSDSGGAAIVDTATVNAWVAQIASRTNASVRNLTAKLNKSKKRVDVSSRTGYKVNQPATVAAIIAELNANMATGDYAVVVAPTAVTKPKNLAHKIILERLTIGSGYKHHGYGYLYNYDGKLQKSFRTAIGKPGYPTPTGTYRIGRKVKMPTWRNPYVGWSMGMPASMQGVNSPLGTRALYVYDGRTDTGIRFHGTASRNSIGTAASHGCLRMKREAVEALYPLVPINTIVYIVK